MSFLSELPRVGVHPGPGTSPPEPYATYVAYSIDSLPTAPEHLWRLDWLATAPRHLDDYLAGAFDEAVRDLDWDGVASLVPDAGTLPEDFGTVS